MLLDSQDDTLVRLAHDFNKERKSITMLICNVGRFDPSATRGHWTDKMKASASWTATLEEPVVRTNITVP
jgi:hypothetical protein